MASVPRNFLRISCILFFFLLHCDLSILSTRDNDQSCNCSGLPLQVTDTANHYQVHHLIRECTLGDCFSRFEVGNTWVYDYKKYQAVEEQGGSCTYGTLTFKIVGNDNGRVVFQIDTGSAAKLDTILVTEESITRLHPKSDSFLMPFIIGNRKNLSPCSAFDDGSGYAYFPLFSYAVSQCYYISGIGAVYFGYVNPDSYINDNYYLLRSFNGADVHLSVRNHLYEIMSQMRYPWVHTMKLSFGHCTQYLFLPDGTIDSTSFIQDPFLNSAYPDSAFGRNVSEYPANLFQRILPDSQLELLDHTFSSKVAGRIMTMTSLSGQLPVEIYHDRNGMFNTMGSSLKADYVNDTMFFPITLVALISPDSSRAFFRISFGQFPGSMHPAELDTVWKRYRNPATIGNFSDSGVLVSGVHEHLVPRPGEYLLVHLRIHGWYDIGW